MSVILGLVPARAGSKGFPGKNLATLASRPLVAWAHRSLSAFRRRHREVVLHLSTDSEQIASAWPEIDRPTRLRPNRLAGDDTPTSAVVEHELAVLKDQGVDCEAVIVLQPTSPLIDDNDLEAMWRMAAAGAESVIAVTPLDHPVEWALRMDGRGLLTRINAHGPSRRQLAAESYAPVGAYLVSADFFNRQREIFVSGESRGVVIPRERTIDIDAPVDLTIAESYLEDRARTAGFSIGSRSIGATKPCFVIAEAGVNHNGDARLAHELVDIAADASADAVKYQVFEPELVVAASAAKASYQAAATGSAESQAEMLKRLTLPKSVFVDLARHASDRGILFLATAFDEPSLDFLDRLGVPAFKVPSGELTNHPYLESVGRRGKPVLVSTGMSTMSEVDEAMAVFSESSGTRVPIALFHCVSAYPAPASECNLNAIRSLGLAFGVPAGWSDHTSGIAISLAAVSTGAAILEKHFTKHRGLPGPDHAASIEPSELKQLIQDIRLIETARGDGLKRPTASEMDTRAVARRSVHAALDMTAGHVIGPDDTIALRPGTGLPPSAQNRLIGRKLRLSVRRGEMLGTDSFE